MQTESANSLKKTKTKSKNEHGTAQEFLVQYNPDYIITHCKGMTIEDINTLLFFAETPTLSELRSWYGDSTPTAWLMPQLLYLSEFCGSKEKMEQPVIERTAFIIYTNFYYLKVSELLLFFYKFTTGRYGHFYGTTDPQIILNALHTFVNQERNPAIERREIEERLKQREEERRNAITYLEYIENYK